MRPGWTPAQDFLDLFPRHDAEALQAAKTRDEIEAYIVELMWNGVSPIRIAKFIPWRELTVAKIGRAAGVPLVKDTQIKTGARKVAKLLTNEGFEIAS
jgi:hypothetical protein